MVAFCPIRLQVFFMLFADKRFSAVRPPKCRGFHQAECSPAAERLIREGLVGKDGRLRRLPPAAPFPPRPPAPLLTPNRADQFACANCTFKRGELGGNRGNFFPQCAANPSRGALPLPPYPQRLIPKRKAPAPPQRAVVCPPGRAAFITFSEGMMSRYSRHYPLIPSFSFLGYQKINHA